LELEPFVTEVLALNPDIRAARAAWSAASQRYPQEISLDDPMFGVMLGPGSWGSELVESAYTLEASQKIPWPGKRQLRGSIAQAEANAAFFGIGEERLRIAEATRIAYYQYFLAHRQLALLDESAELLQGFRDIALRKFEAAEAEQQDVLLADVELAELERQRLEYLQAERVARARLNTLRVQPPNSELPPPPVTLELSQPLPPSDELQATALGQRPELAGQSALIRRERYAAALARKEFLPDVEFVARYDAFWQEEELRPMVGMNLNLPIYKNKRWAAIREANARGAREQAQLEASINEIRFRVEQSYQRVKESEQTLKIYLDRILPSARHSVEAARASYMAGRLDFLRLIESQRQLLRTEEGYHRALAEYHQRFAELEREVGGVRDEG
jgi:outer membrane protein TolC